MINNSPLSSNASGIALLNGAHQGDAHTTPLKDSLFAAIATADIDAIHALLSHSEADISAINDQGQTLFHAAVASNNLQALHILLTKSGDHSPLLEALDQDGMTVLMHAAKSDQRDILRVLINAGALLETKSRIEGYSALDFSVSFARVATRNMLADMGADRSSAIVIAADKNYASTTSNLLNRGSSIGDAMLLAGERGWTNAVKTLDSYFDVDMLTVMQRAAELGKMRVIETILQYANDTEDIAQQFPKIMEKFPVADDEPDALLRHAVQGGYITTVKILIAISNRDSAESLLQMAGTLTRDEIQFLCGAGVDASRALWYAAQRNQIYEGGEHHKAIRALREVGANLSIALMYAAQAGQTEVIGNLMRVGANPSTALLHAVKHAHVSVDTVDKLLDAGASVNAKNSHDETVLMLAAKNGDEAVVNKLLKKGAHIDAQDKRGYTALMMAAEFNRVAVIHALRNKAANIYAVSAYQPHQIGQVPHSSGDNALMIATEKGNTPAIEALLLGLPEKDLEKIINMRNSEGYTPMMIAAKHDCHGAVLVLCQYGAGTELSVSDGMTPVLIAAHNKSCNAMTALGAVGANLNAKTHASSATALMIAASRDDTEMINALQFSGADLNAVDRAGRTALFIAIETGSAQAFDALWALGASTQIRTKTDSTTLMAAAALGRTEMARALIQDGIDVDARDVGGDTALMAAARGGHVDVLHLFLNAKVNVQAVDRIGKSAMDYATEFGHTTARLLLAQARQGSR